MKSMIIVLLCAISNISFAMQQEGGKKESSQSPSRPLALFNQLFGGEKRTSSQSPVRAPVTSPSPSSSHSAPPAAAASAQAVSPRATADEKRGARKSPSNHASARLSRTIGKNDSKDFVKHLEGQITDLEMSDIALTEEELNARYDQALKENDEVAKKKKLERLACAKIKGEVSLDVGPLKRKAADAVFRMRAHQMAMMLTNRITYLNQNDKFGLQEAENQVSPVMELYFQQHSFLLRFYEAEQNPNFKLHQNFFRTCRKMAPIFRAVEEHLQKDPRGSGKLYEYQNAIKEEQFVPINL